MAKQDFPSATCQFHLETVIELKADFERQKTTLETVSSDVKAIKESLVGSVDHPGLLVEIDRLKRSQSILNAVTWFAFTTTIGAILTFVVSSYLTRT